MLDTVLGASFATTTIATLLLIAGGPRLLGRGGRAPLVVAVGVLGVVAGGLVGQPAVAALGVGLAALAAVLPRRWSPLGAVFAAALVSLCALYVVALVRATVALGGGPAGMALGLLLLALEVGAIGLILAAAIEMVDALCSTGPAVEPTRPEPPERWPVVALQIPTYNEPPELVIETLRSLAALAGPPIRIQVIDNNTTDERLWRPVEAECARLAATGVAVSFVHLAEWPGYKAGALNWGRVHLDPDVEVVGVIDADYVVEPDWLVETVPWFADADVDFVQTPQDYRAWETSAFYRACYIGFAYFFRVGMVSRSHRNSIIFAGTMGLIRRATLDAVGGWDERIITEDAEISLRVLARGGRAIYVNRPFGRGIMPLTYEGLRKQRFRWAFGGIQILRRHWRTILGPGSGLTFGQRYDHLVGGLWWFNDALTFGFSLFVAATAIGVITGRPFVVQRLTALGLVLPVAMIVLNLLRYLWALRTATGSGAVLALAALRVNLSLSWVIALACLRGLTQERGVFLRTPKFRGTASIRELRLVSVEATLAGVAVVLAAMVALGRGFAPATVPVIVLLGWMAVIYGSSVGYALGDPDRAPTGVGLADKMRLEVAPRMGRVARSRPARAGLIGLLLAVAAVAVLGVESDRTPIAELPFQELPPSRIDFGGLGIGPASTPGPSAVPSGSPSASSPAAGSAAPPPPSGQGVGTPPPGGAGGGSSGPSPTPRPTSRPTPNPTTSPTPSSTPPPSARPTAPVPVPTPRGTTPPTPPPHPTPSIPIH